MKNMKLKKTYGYLLLLPSLFLLTVFVFYPLLQTFYLSFFDWNLISPNKEFVGLANYMAVLKDPIFHKVLKNTVIYAVLFVLLSGVFPYIVAFLLDIVIVRFKDFYKQIFFVPAVISLVVAGMVFTWILNPVSGPVALVLGKIGISMPIWTNSTGWVVSTLAFITAWKVFGYNFIVLYAAIAGIDREIIEAANLDGLSDTEIFIKVVVPLSSSTGIYVLIMTIVQGLQYVFTPIKVITQGGPNNASSNIIYYTYQKAFEMYKVGEAAALSVLTLIIFGVLLSAVFKFIERGIYYEN